MLGEIEVMSKFIPYLISSLVGAVTWLGIGAWSGRSEAWDSNLFWSIGTIVMMFSVIFIAYIWPERSWRWGFTIIGAQAIIGLIQAFPHINLWPLSLVLFFILSLPLVILATVVSAIKRHVNNKQSA